MTAFIIAFFAVVGATVGLACWIGAIIHCGHPIRETPMRVVKMRGSFVDMET